MNSATIKRCVECGSINELGDAICSGCGHTEFEQPDSVSTYLECDHCGDVAVESATGIFHEDMADKCESCGHPGQVNVGESDCCWLPSDSATDFCANNACDECGELARKETARLEAENTQLRYSIAELRDEIRWLKGGAR